MSNPLGGFQNQNTDLTNVNSSMVSPTGFGSAKNNINWKWDKSLNRLCREKDKVQPTEFHQETMNYIRSKRKTLDGSPQQSYSMDIPKKLTIKGKIDNYEKVDLIREQMRKIEQQKKKA